MLNNEFTFKESEINMLNEIETSKSKVLTKLQENLELHKKIHEETKDTYTKELIKELENKLENIKAGTLVNFYMNKAMPASHEKEYVQAIEMIKWSDKENIVLNASQFKKFILDDWEWSRDFFLNSVEYSSTAASGCSLRGYNG